MECIKTRVMPRSLFASAGSLLLAYDKASVFHHREKLNIFTQNVENNELSLNDGHFGRHLGFHTTRMFRKNATHSFFYGS